MFSALIVAVAFSMVQAQCPCHPYNDDVTYMVCDNETLTSIPDCVPSNISILSIGTASIPLVPDTIRRFTNLNRVNIEFFDNPQISTSFLSSQKNISFFQIYVTSLNYVDNEWFLFTPYIKTMILSYNNINTLSSDTFTSMPLLETVTLNNNRLSTLPPTLFQGTALKNLYIDDNPWQCDCELATFIQWTRDNGVMVTDGAICSYPLEFQGVNVKDVTVDLACKK